ncbi:SGNH hydrolase [Actinoplanes italicus]|uniref:Lysophospholipase L1-like esterase n=1 Tax=Actinoplanes italicus TaxID=113567 RepID=A0A2T0KCH0_9ACTN|nr:SGNH/GDSL hydrolase family protein [Actinoplanes italicus]PRX20917.1 lysophospholipase L1-like esterase [Actinoplanes italicus]GIE31391.1 SGNH hydrolase [Actinoplanes italicus]
MVKVQAAGGPVHGHSPGPDPELRLAVLGDSSAAGFGAPDHETALAGQLAGALAGHLGRAVSWRVAARGGATARTVAALIPALSDPTTGRHPDIVLVVVGVNDTTRLRRPAAFHRDVSRLISSIRGHLATSSAGTRILLAGLPPVHRFPALPAPVRTLFGAHARRLDRQLAALAAASPDTHHLPVGDLPLDQPGLFAEDGFHPAPAAYRVWGEILAARAAPLLT